MKRPSHATNPEQLPTNPGRGSKLALLLAAATIATGVAAAQSAFGNFVRFDGVDDRIDCGNWAGLYIHTLEVWVRADPSTQSPSIVAGQNGIVSFCGQGYSLRAVSNGFQYHLDPSGCQNGGGPFAGNAFGAWHHMAQTFDGSTGRMYMDGALVATQSHSSGTFNRFMIGAFADGSSCFRGDIDEVRIWNIVRTQAEIQSDMCPDPTVTGAPGLVGYWDFDEASGQTAIDHSGLNRSGMFGTSASSDSADPVRMQSDLFTITSVSPSFGSTSGGGTVVVSGTGFLLPGMVAMVGGHPLQNTTITGATITGYVSSHAEGLVDVVVSTPQCSAVRAAGYRYVDGMCPPPIYQTDFSTAPGVGWSHSLVSTTPAGGNPYLGPFGNDTVTVNIGAPSVYNVVIAFDVYVIGGWDGNAAGCCGPDRFQVMADGAILVDTTFAQAPGALQAYPGSWPADNYPAGTGSAATQSLGFGCNAPPCDRVYHMTLAAPYSGSGVILSFRGIGLDALSDESWGLDNFRVYRSYDGTGQNNSQNASMTINGIGGTYCSGPFYVGLQTGQNYTLDISGPPLAPFAVFVGGQHPGGSIPGLPCAGSLDIGLPPAYVDMAALLDGIQNPAFSLDGAGQFSVSGAIPMAAGLLANIQAVVLQPSSCVVRLTAASYVLIE